jgi:hypothetical protein
MGETSGVKKTSVNRIQAKETIGDLVEKYSAENLDLTSNKMFVNSFIIRSDYELRKKNSTRVDRFFSVQHTKTRSNIPNDHRIYQTDVKYSKWPLNIPKISVPRLSKFGSLVCKNVHIPCGKPEFDSF